MAKGKTCTERRSWRREVHEQTFRLGGRVRIPKRNHRYQVSLEVNLCLHIPVGTTHSLLYLMVIMRNGPMREKWALEIGGLDFL